MSRRGIDEADRRARALLQAIPDGVGVVDAEGTLLEVNDRFCASTGFTPEELIGCTAPLPFYPEEELQTLLDAAEHVRAEGSGHFRLILKRKDGERFPVTVGVSQIDDPGQDPRLLCVVRDLTREERERERLREAHRVAGLASWEWDPVTDRVDGSRQLVRASGLPAGEWTLARMLTHLVPGHRHRLRDGLDRVLSGEEDELVVEYQVEVPTGRLEWVETRASAVRDPEGRVLRVRATTQDVTARKRTEHALERSEARLRLAQETADLGSFEVDHRTARLRWSDQLYRLYGLDPAAAPDLTLADALKLQHPADRETLARLGARCLETGEAQRHVHRYLRGRDTRWAESRIEALVEDGVRVGVRGTQQDVTDRKRTEGQIAFQAELLDAVDAAVIATDLAGTVTHWNGGAERMYGWRRAEIVGRSIAELGGTAAGDARAIDDIRASVLASEQWEGEIDARRKDGSAFPAYVRNALFTSPDGRPAGIVGVSVDISERVAHERRLTAAHDYLRTVTDAMGQGLVTVDDEGHLIYINRAGEDLLGYTQTELSGQRMHELVHPEHPDGTPYPREDCPLRRVSATSVPAHLDDEVFVRKDGRRVPVEVVSAPFQTDDGQRGSVVLFSDITQRKAEERRLREQMEALTWVGRIRAALRDDRFVLHAQPIVDVATGKTVQHELLIRMLGDDDELIPPCRFLPVAEEHGLIGEIDRWVVSEAMGLAAAGHPVELNLSAHSIGDRAVLDHFRAEIERTGADPSLIVVELTETALVMDEPAAERFIDGVSAMGCGLALDDFGTGYGGLSYLKRLPVDCLKIDREFIADLPYDEASQHVVRAVVSLAKGFGQLTVAEGVEDRATLELLCEYGIDRAQGYVVGHPRPVAEVFAGQRS